MENDYLHLPNSYNVLKEGLDFGVAYVTLYDHPDKYLDTSLGGHPYWQGGGSHDQAWSTSNEEVQGQFIGVLKRKSAKPRSFTNDSVSPETFTSNSFQ